MNSRPALVVLAAGASTRLGEPKALARIGGRTALAHLLEAWTGSGGAVADVHVVVGAFADRVRPEVPTGARVVENPDWASGRTGSLQAALEGLRQRDAVVAAVDTPLVAAETLRALLGAWSDSGAPARGWLAPATAREPEGPAPGRANAPDQPEGKLRPGHPVLLGRQLLAEVALLGTDHPLRDLRRRAEPCWMIPVPDEAIHDDLDTPADLERLRARFRS